jgi:hypothetical protein
MDEGIFSTYRQGENRVTASILAVLRSLALSRIEQILGVLLKESDFQLVRFENQIAGTGNSVPDAKIAANVTILLETKTKRNSLEREQLVSHLKQLPGTPGSRLLVLTPDHTEPDVISEIGGDHLVWSSFMELDQAINDLLSKEKEVVSEREEFLLRELQKMLEADHLLRPAKEVVVVAARLAWPEYQMYHAYVCQADRSFQQVKYLAFYSDGQIQDRVPEILRVEPRVVFQRGLHKGPLGDIVRRMLDDGRRTEGNSHMVFVLSAPDSEKTIKLDQPVMNDRPTAFVQGQRYISLTALRNAKDTSDLEPKTEQP